MKNIVIKPSGCRPTFSHGGSLIHHEKEVIILEKLLKTPLVVKILNLMTHVKNRIHARKKKINCFKF